jgi:single-stranded-DNA-specific exonuclease
MTSFVSLSSPRRTWSVAEIDPMTLGRVASSVDTSREVARMLVERGVTDEASARSFLDGELDTVWRDPETLPGMTAAADAVAAAIAAGKRILVYGDFDVDGITAAAVAALGLKMCGGSGTVIVPNRFIDGYGLTDSSVARIMAADPELVVTVDCGVSAGPEVAQLRAAGIEVVVTDHHEPGTLVPEGVPVTDPKLGDYPFPELSGAGVALKLVQALCARLGKGDAWRELTDLAAIGTVADIVPLLDENRALVATGLRRMRIHPRPGIAALAETAGITLPALTADRIAFGMAPRLNAAGRMADPRIALRLLLAPDLASARPLAAELERLNRERQAVEGRLLEEAEATALVQMGDDDRAVVLAGEGWHDGVKGIVASRLVGRFGRPALMFCVEDGQARGSGRSVADVDLFEAVTACSDLLTRYGGHKQAVGVSLPERDLPEFRTRLSAFLADLPEESFAVRRSVDAEMAMSDVTTPLARELRVLEPHGHGNPKPVFVAPAVHMRDVSCVGRDADHLRFLADDGTGVVPAIAFRCDDIDERLVHDGEIGIVFEIQADEYRGRERVQLMVRDFVRPA